VACGFAAVSAVFERVLETLTSFESALQLVFVAAALAGALWCAVATLRSATTSGGEVVWSVVAAVVLVGVIAAVRFGAGHGG
jgi:uncharacterized membrane protein